MHTVTFIPMCSLHCQLFCMSKNLAVEVRKQAKLIIIVEDWLFEQVWLFKLSLATHAALLFVQYVCSDEDCSPAVETSAFDEVCEANLWLVERELQSTCSCIVLLLFCAFYVCVYTIEYVSSAHYVVSAHPPLQRQLPAKGTFINVVSAHSNALQTHVAK